VLSDDPVRVAIFNDTRSDHHYGCELVMKNLLTLLAGENAQVVWSWPVNRDWRKFRDYLPEPGTVDLILVNGEGSMHDGGRRWRPQALADVAELAQQHFKVPAFLLNATFYNNPPTLYEKLHAFTGLWVRDRASQALLAEHGLEADYAPDLTLSIPAPAHHAAGGVNRNQALIRDQQASGIWCIDSVLAPVREKLTAIAQQRGWEYYSLNTAPRFPHWPRLPLRLRLKLLFKYYNPLARRQDFGCVDDFLRAMVQAKALISGRYHAVTMALLTGTPFVAVESNTPKSSNLLMDVFGETNRSITVDNLETADVLPELMGWDARENHQRLAFLDLAEERNGQMIKAVTEAARQNRSARASGSS